MKLTRRQFLHGTTAGTASLLIPQSIEEALARIESIGAGFPTDVDPPYVSLVYQRIISRYRQGQNNEYSGYLLSLFGPINTPSAPVMTHKEAAAFLGYEDLNEYARENLMVDEKGVPEMFNPDGEAELGIYFKDWYYPYDYFEATEYAYWWLRNLRSDLRKKGQLGLDEVEFIDKSAVYYVRPTNDCPRFAQAPDKESLLLVQQQLEKLGIGTIVQYQDRESSWPNSQRDSYEKAALDLFINGAQERSHE